MELTKHGIVIGAISETKKNRKGTFWEYRNDYVITYINTGKENQAKGGVDIMVHKKYKDSIEEWPYIWQNFTDKINTQRVSNVFICVCSWPWQIHTWQGTVLWRYVRVNRQTK